MLDNFYSKLQLLNELVEQGISSLQPYLKALVYTSANFLCIFLG